MSQSVTPRFNITTAMLDGVTVLPEGDVILRTIDPPRSDGTNCVGRNEVSLKKL